MSSTHTIDYFYLNKKGIMKKICITLFIPIFTFAQVHYAKIEPYERIELKSSTSGLVSDVAVENEGTFVELKSIIHVEDILEKENLKEIQSALTITEKMLGVNQKITMNLKKLLKRKKSQYHRYTQITTASKSQKDNAFNAFVTAETQYLQYKEKILSLKKEILNYKHQIFQLKDTIAKKSIVVKNQYLYKLMVRQGDFVTSGTPLAIVYSTQQAKLTLFLLPEELKDIHKKTIYIDDSKTAYKINKIWDIADEKHVSAYRTEIYVDAPKRFSELKKVEFK